MKFGIQDIELATTHYRVPLDGVAQALDIDPAKFRLGLRQEQFSIPALDEDCVTMGATAASRLIERTGIEGVRTLIFATESSIDQAKAGGVFVHSLLGLPNTIRTVETKQACYAGVASLQMALGIVARNPKERVLLIMSDVARYEAGTPGEPTQGAGAVAVMIGADPAVLEIEPTTGVWTEDVNDFWRPNDFSWPHVDGALSLKAYLNTLAGAWEDYQAHGGVGIGEIDRFVHHQPFTKMSVKAHSHLASVAGMELSAESLEPSLAYTPQIGNTYTAAVFVGLLSLLNDSATKPGMRVGVYSYGSGATGEFFTGIVGADFTKTLDAANTRAMLDAREPLTYQEYRDLHKAHERGSKQNYTNPRVTKAPFRYVGVTDGARQYERNA